jgi:hypothetical protein
MLRVLHNTILLSVPQHIYSWLDHYSLCSFILLIVNSKTIGSPVCQNKLDKQYLYYNNIHVLSFVIIL